MVALSTPTINTGFVAKDFNLLGIDGKYYNLNDCIAENGLLVMFICNHCPYVKSIVRNLVYDVSVLQNSYGINAVAIMSNDTNSYPEDSYDIMKLFAKENSFCFPYVIDSDQSVARSYGAVCTPDFFGFNYNKELCYRGRFAKPRDSEKERELFKAMKYIAQTAKVPDKQYPSIGCSIKWIS